MVKSGHINARFFYKILIDKNGRITMLYLLIINEKTLKKLATVNTVFYLVLKFI